LLVVELDPTQASVRQKPTPLPPADLDALAVVTLKSPLD
jgi:hypothetical protein